MTKLLIVDYLSCECLLGLQYYVVKAQQLISKSFVYVSISLQLSDYEQLDATIRIEKIKRVIMTKYVLFSELEIFSDAFSVVAIIISIDLRVSVINKDCVTISHG